MTGHGRLLKPVRRTSRGLIIRLRPPEILLIGFTLLALLGMLLLRLPVMTTAPIGWLEALFTAASAVTVTGLSVVSVAQELTFYGQLLILVLIQIGGLGFMTLAALTVLLLGRRLPLNQQNLVRESLNQSSLGQIGRLVRVIALFAVTIELIGATLLALDWVPELGWRHGLWASVFLSISAFNNAGFSIFHDSLGGDVGDSLVNLVITGQFIIGGLGFAVIGELRQHRKGRRLSTQTRLILSATLIINLVGMLLLLLLEWRNPATLGGLPHWDDRLWAAWFQAVTPRTAGFHTVDTGALTMPGTLLTMLLMFIGGGPSSTASGIKVTTFVVLLLTARAFVQGRNEPVAFQRRMSPETVTKAVAVAMASMLLIFVALFLLTVTQQHLDFMDLAFETVSAFGTVGLSRGITDQLTPIGQLLLIVTMLLGRVGPLSLGYLVASRRVPGTRFATEHMQIG